VYVHAASAAGGRASKQSTRRRSVIHPECGCTTSAMYLLGEGVLSRRRGRALRGACRLRTAVPGREFVVATEVGITTAWRGEPSKRFLPMNREAVCPI